MDSQRFDAALSGKTGSAQESTDDMRILILGGTTEARQLAGRLATQTGLTVALSLAGRTAEPAAQPVPVRIGGFGGAQGLADYLRDENIDALVDATHPYAATISANAATAAAQAGVALVTLRRPAWTPVAGDRWVEVGHMADAVQALGAAPRRVFLALGRKEIAPFEAAPQHRYLVRSVDPVDPPLAVPHAVYVTARGPFPEAGERALLQEHSIEIIVAKNSGGAATYGKIAASRALSLPVVMLRRPAPPDVAAVETVDEAVDWLDHLPAFATARGV
jgi:precorrin-6A/cobalt-precorrin-6A reductase